MRLISARSLWYPEQSMQYRAPKFFETHVTSEIDMREYLLSMNYNFNTMLETHLYWHHSHNIADFLEAFEFDLSFSLPPSKVISQL